MRESVIIALAILGGSALIALALGLSLGLRPMNDKSSATVECYPPPGMNAAASSSGSATQKNIEAPIDEAMKEEDSDTRRFYKYRQAAITSRDPVCTQIGMDIIMRGGSAADGAIAAQMCIGTTFFSSCGIGGGHFMTVYDREKGSTQKSVKTLLARETLPQAGNKEYFLTHDSQKGGTAVGVPSNLHGLYTAWQMYGRVPWRDLITPSIKLAEGGFKIPEALANAIIAETHDNIKTYPGIRDVLMKPNGSIAGLGDTIKRPKFARTLKIIADDPMSFYNGTLADEVIADLQDAGSIMVKQDLEQYQTRVRLPIKGHLKSQNLTMYFPEPPSSGVVVQFFLRICDGFGFNKDSLKDMTTAIETYHKIMEASKFAFAKRSGLGDPDFWNITTLLKNMTDDAYVDSTRSKIDLTQTHDLDYYDHLYTLADDHGTTHTSVLSPDGGAVSLTATLNFRFGSKVYGSRTGIAFNNEMDDFSKPSEEPNNFEIYPSESNFPAPGKNPMSSMSPAIFLTDSGEVAYITGASGGPRIISHIVFVALHNLYFGLDLKTSVDMARLHHQLLPNEVRYQKEFNMDILAGLHDQYNHMTVENKLAGYVGIIQNLCAHGCAHSDASCREACVHAITDDNGGGGTYGY